MSLNSFCCGKPLEETVLSSLFRLLEDGFKHRPELLRLGDELPDGLQLLLVLTSGNPQLDVSRVGVFVFEMFGEPVPLLLLRHFGVMVSAIKDCSSEHRFGVKLPVGLRHNLAVDASWSV